jgi:hypothetical protein
MRGHHIIIVRDQTALSHEAGLDNVLINFIAYGVHLDTLCPGGIG